MKTQRFMLFMCLLNAGLLFFLAAKPRHEVYEKITVRAFELVDKKGVARVSIQSYDDGEVVLRMKDAKGTIRLKMGASEDGSGLVLLNDATEPGIHALAQKKGTSITMTDKDGKKKAL
ncbi:hypothetical protein [Runella rosea]|nr:hypothetical protein [Runella rosea]